MQNYFEFGFETRLNLITKRNTLMQTIKRCMKQCRCWTCFRSGSSSGLQDTCLSASWSSNGFCTGDGASHHDDIDSSPSCICTIMYIEPQVVFIALLLAFDCEVTQTYGHHDQGLDETVWFENEVTRHTMPCKIFNKTEMLVIHTVGHIPSWCAGKRVAIHQQDGMSVLPIRTRFRV